jgi:DNA-binding transcriptional regulator of glucitol operon
MEYLPLTLLLLGTLLLTMTFAHLQHRYYLRAVNHLAAEHRGPGMALVSGISRGRLRGAVAILVVRRDSDTIERALVMEGSSILARFREQTALHGQSLTAIAGVPLSKRARLACDDAAARYHQVQLPAAAPAQPAPLVEPA